MANGCLPGTSHCIANAVFIESTLMFQILVFQPSYLWKALVVVAWYFSMSLAGSRASLNWCTLGKECSSIRSEEEHLLVGDAGCFHSALFPLLMVFWLVQNSRKWIHWAWMEVVLARVSSWCGCTGAWRCELWEAIGKQGSNLNVCCAHCRIEAFGIDGGGSPGLAHWWTAMAFLRGLLILCKISSKLWLCV